MAGSALGIVVPLYIKDLIDLKNIFKSALSLSFIAKLAVVLVVQTILSSGGDFLISREGERQIVNIRQLLESHLLELPVSFFDEQDSGKLASRIINDSILVKDFITETIPSFITSLITVVGTFAVLFTLDWKLTLVIFTIFPLDAAFTIPLGNFEEKLTIDTQKSLSDLSGITTESLRNIRAVKLNGAETGILAKFVAKLKRLYKLSIKNDAVFAVLSPIQDMVSFVLIVSVLFYGGYRVQTSTLTVGALTSFLIYFFQIVNPINVLASFYTDCKQMKGAVSKISDILGKSTEKYHCRSLNVKVNEPYNLTISNLSFAYGQKKVLERINMQFPTEKKIAIVGPTGAGKSTLINLITRLYNPTSGAIKLNEINSNEFALEDWRSLFGVVSQENYIISGTIYDNLVFGLQQQPSASSLNEAIAIANLAEFIAGLKHGIAEVVGEQGIKLSGGQRQKIQIAQAYLRNPRFLILDEATSNLDANSEAEVSQALKHVMQGRTIITIAHRLATITDSDRIYFLDNKTIVGSGNHEELLKKVPKYRRFVKEQILPSNSHRINGVDS